MGTSLAAAGSFMAIVGLVGFYLSARAGVLADGGVWLPDGTTIPLTPGNMAMATMLISGVTMWWAVDAVGKNDRQMAYLALGLTIFFGIAVINATTFLYSQMHLPVATSQGVMIYTITGLHLAMMVGGLLYAGVMTFRTLGGEYHAETARASPPPPCTGTSPSPPTQDLARASTSRSRPDMYKTGSMFALAGFGLLAAVVWAGPRATTPSAWT
ncbi:MAG: cytochrome c oxidase subunit 3 [Acidimicrobiales bacterium]